MVAKFLLTLTALTEMCFTLESNLLKMSVSISSIMQYNLSVVFKRFLVSEWVLSITVSQHLSTALMPESSSI